MTLTSSRCAPLSSCLHGGFQKADEGDLNDLLRLGFSLPFIRKIQNLPPRKHKRACDRMAAYLSHLLQQALGNRQQQERLEAILAQIEADDFDDLEQDQLILKKAPREMMSRLYGMTYQDFATRRAALQVADTGRPRQVSPNQEKAIRASWRQQAGLPYSKRFLRVAQDTHLDLRTLWPVLRWALDTQEIRPRSKRPSPLGAAAEPLAATGQRE